MKSMLHRLTILSLIAVMLFGVNLAAAQKGDEVDTSDWILQRGAKSYVYAPDGWLNVTDPDAMGDIIDRITATNPQFASVFEMIQPQIEAGLIDLYLIEPLTTATLAVLISDLGVPITLEALEASLPAQYATVGGEIVDTEMVDLPIGQALKVHVTLPVRTETGQTIISEQYQYFVMDGTNLVALNFGGAQSSFEDLSPLFEAVALSFGLGEPPADSDASQSGGTSGDGTETESGGKAGSKGDKATSPINERTDIIRIEGDGFTMVAPSDWLDVTDPDALSAYIAAGNAVDPVAQSFFESMANQVTGNSFSLVYVQPRDLAFVIHYAVEFPAEIPMANLEDSVLQPIKDDPEIELVDNQIVQTTAGEALRVDVRRPIRDVTHYEIRYIILGAGQMNFFFFAVPETAIDQYRQTFEDMINTLNFTR